MHCFRDITIIIDGDTISALVSATVQDGQMSFLSGENSLT